MRHAALYSSPRSGYHTSAAGRAQFWSSGMRRRLGSLAPTSSAFFARSSPSFRVNATKSYRDNFRLVTCDPNSNRYTPGSVQPVFSSGVPNVCAIEVCCRIVGVGKLVAKLPTGGCLDALLPCPSLCSVPPQPVLYEGAVLPKDLLLYAAGHMLPCRSPMLPHPWQRVRPFHGSACTSSGRSERSSSSTIL